MSDRTVTTDALATLGTIITDKEKRDAIHLGVIPVRAGCTLNRAQHVGIDDTGKAMLFGVESIGIVDPFIRGVVNKGEWFWLVIYPRVITTLRHVWTHPKIADELKLEVMEPSAPSEDDKAVSELWLRSWADEHYVEYDDMIAAAVSSSEYVSAEYGYQPDTDTTEEFWRHVETVHGSPVDRATRENFYINCSC